MMFYTVSFVHIKGKSVSHGCYIRKWLLHLPAIASGSVKEGGKVASASKGVKYLNNTNGYLNYKVNSGSYQFRFYDAEKQEL